LASLIQKQNEQFLARIESERIERESRKAVAIQNSLNQYLSLQLPKQIHKTMQKHINNEILPFIKDQYLKNFDEKIKTTAQQVIIPAMETTIKEIVEKYCESNLKNTTAETFKENFTSILSPAFDKSCQEMFNQLRQVFSPLLDDYQNQQQLISQNWNQSNLEVQLVNEIITVLKSLADLNEKLNNTQSLLSNTSNIAKTEEKVVALETQISALLDSKSFEAAFEKTLQQQNPTLLNWLITKVEPESVYPVQRAGLSSFLTLSLMKQLGSTLDTLTEEKLGWIQFCISSLDTPDTEMNEDWKKVLSKLQEEIGHVSQQQPQYNRITRIILYSLARLLTHKN